MTSVVEATGRSGRIVADSATSGLYRPDRAGCAEVGLQARSGVVNRGPAKYSSIGRVWPSQAVSQPTPTSAAQFAMIDSRTEAVTASIGPQSLGVRPGSTRAGLLKCTSCAARRLASLILNLSELALVYSAVILAP